jgi:hypothetical protein
MPYNFAFTLLLKDRVWAAYGELSLIARGFMLQKNDRAGLMGLFIELLCRHGHIAPQFLKKNYIIVLSKRRIRYV